MMRRRVGIGFVAVVSLLFGMTSDGAGAQPTPDRRAASKHPRLATSLLDEAGLAPRADTEGATSGPWSDAQGRIKVAVDGDDSRLAPAVQAVGGELDAEGPGTVHAYIPPNRLTELANAPGVRWVYEPLRFEPDVLSEGVAETGMAAWHLGGQQGAGVTVGIVDVGFAGYTGLLGTELPATVQTHAYCDNGMAGGIPGSPIDHGTAVAEIVHDMAPAADLYLVCVDTGLDMVDAASLLQAAGVPVVNASIGNPLFGRGDGTGRVGDAVRQSRLAGTLWAVSAGNNGDSHFNFIGTGVNEFGSVLLGPNNPVYSITVPPSGVFGVSVKWDAWPTTNQDFDLLLYDSLTDYQFGDFLTGSFGPQDGTQPPIEGFAYQNPPGATRTYFVEIFAFDGNPARLRFDLFINGAFNSVEAVTPGSVSEPASSPYVMTAGAYDFANGQLEAFSSRGPTIDQRVKPDIAGPDGVSTQTFGAGAFFGTSAAAPHTAGAAAVLLGANPELDVAELQAILEGRAQDAGPQGLDNLYGAGRLRLGAVGTPQPPTGDLYVGVDPPVRIIDTRRATGCGVSPCGALGPGQTRTFTVAGQSFGPVDDPITVPPDASAVVFNVTAVSPTATGFVTVYPTGQARPNVANLNTRPGQTRPNHVTATVSAAGQVSFYNAAGNTHLVFDLAGYYSPSEGEVGLVPLNPPGRAMDTRQTGGAFGPGEVRALAIAGETIGGTPIPDSARAVVMNVTVTQPTGIGFLTVWPGGVRPLVASLNFVPHQTVPNLVIATLGDDGTVSFYNSTGGSTHLVVDVMGFYDDPGNPDTVASRYVPINPPRRNLDTRSGNGLRLGALTPNLEFDHQTRLLYGVPEDASAALMNLTVAGPTRSGFITVFPDGVPRPLSANLNFLAGEVVPNAVISSIGTSGRITIYNGGGGSTHVIVDLGGYFVPSG